MDTNTPADSSILTKPLHTSEGGTGHGGGNLFADTNDANYQTILKWITEGAENN